MEAVHSLSLHHPILLLKTLSDGQLGCIDAQNTLRIIDKNSYHILNGFKTNILHSRLARNRVDCSSEGEYTVGVVEETGRAGIFSLSKKELLYTVAPHEGKIESVGIDPNGRYFLTFDREGKGYGWVVKTSRLAFVLPSHEECLSAISFSDDGQWIATGGYDKSIILFNIASMKEPFTLYAHTSPLVGMTFLPEGKLLSAEQSGGLIVWDIAKNKPLKKLISMDDEITGMCISGAKRFVAIVTKSGNIGLYDMHSMDRISPRYLKLSGTISSVTFLSDPIRLVIATLEGSIFIYSLFGDEKLYTAMLRRGEYAPFYAALDENPMLYYSKLYGAVEKIWSDTVDQGRAYLEKNELQQAKEVFAPFAAIAKKHPFITQLFSSYTQYEQFETAIAEGHLALAYSLAKQFPPFQESELYRTMESKWKKNFYKAQQLILTKNGEEQARELLAPYRGISEKTIHIQQLFEQRKMYEYFKKTIAQHDYVKFFGLVKKYPFLQEFEEYTEVMEYADKLYIQTQKGYDKGDYATARKGCEILVFFPDYAQEAQKMAATIRIKHLFYEAIAANSLPNAFSYLSAYPLLNDTREAQMLQRQWYSTVDKAQKFASVANAREIRAVFEPYFGVRDKYRAMAGIMAQAYCVQLEEKITHDAPLESIERGIRNYIGLFGVDEGIRSVVEYLKRVTQSKIDLQGIKKGSLQSWSPMIRIDDITARG
jgi:WD40 repeat protein